MLKKCILILLTISLFLSSCADTQDKPPQGGAFSEQGSGDILATPDIESPSEPTLPIDPGGEPQNEPNTKASIAQLFEKAITEFTAEVQVNVSGMTWEFGAENDLKNIYYSVLSEYPELKYAYSMEAEVLGDTATCKFLYMPYKTGAYDSGVPAGSHTVGSLYDAKVMAQSMIDGTERMAIAITDPTLSVEDIQLALAQAGYGWIRFNLSRDGTEIIAEAPVGKTLAESVSAINDSFQLGSEILISTVTDQMTTQEKVKAIYDYIVKNVSYDFRYYSDPQNMPYESTVAIGALRDNLAICGGYAQAFETLLDMLGIENYTVSGISKGEYHMWNYVVLDEVGYYCDPTADRGGMSNHFMLSEEELSASGDYSWNHEFLKKISI